MIRRRLTGEEWTAWNQMDGSERIKRYQHSTEIIAILSPMNTIARHIQPPDREPTLDEEIARLRVKLAPVGALSKREWQVLATLAAREGGDVLITGPTAPGEKPL